MTAILPIEGDPTIRLATEFSLTKHGYAESSCEDGTSGYETALSIEPDLVLLDVMLQGMDGFEVAKRLRSVLDEYSDYTFIHTVHGMGYRFEPIKKTEE